MNIAAAALTALLLLQLAPFDGDATIRGRVVDADGLPMPDVEVRAVLMGAEQQAIGGIGTSDAAGKFEIAKVPPGRFLLRVQPRVRVVKSQHDLRRVNHPPAYFPGVLSLDEAWPIEVGAKEIIELDFYMPPVLVGTIKTVVSGPDGYTLDQLRVIRPEGNQIKNVKVDADGVGYAEDLREARYVVAARGRTKEHLLAAFQIVHVSPGQVPVDLRLEPASRITGRVVSDRGGIPAIDNMRVAAAWTDGAIDLDPLARDEASVGPDGSFTIDGLFGTRAIRVAGLDDGWQVTSIRHGHADISSSPIDLGARTTTEITIVLSRK